MNPALLQAIKDALGITDTSKDAQLTLIGNGVLQAMRKATARVLYPLHNLKEIFSPVPFCCRGPSQVPVILSQLPVSSLVQIKLNKEDRDIADFQVAPQGNLLSADGSPVFIGSGVEVTYQAGFTELPADLFMALVALCRQGIENPGGPVRKVSIVDVGTIDYGETGGPGSDPILGDWLTTIESYSSPAQQIGGHPNAQIVVLGMVPVSAPPEQTPPEGDPPPVPDVHVFVDNYSNGFIRLINPPDTGTIDIALATTPGPGGAIYPAMGDIPGGSAVWADYSGSLAKVKMPDDTDVLGSTLKEWIRRGSVLTVHRDNTNAAHPVMVVDQIAEVS